ncbi:hypothetical protein GCM10009001_08670 [Virgibacillus siamensis]|uniref:Uncharacterized protein n=1 Tax=Virgibacillus siamensis TaxID=480071 RepID=A0ABN1FNX8_9BACI
MALRDENQETLRICSEAFLIRMKRWLGLKWLAGIHSYMLGFVADMFVFDGDMLVSHPICSIL